MLERYHFNEPETMAAGGLVTDLSEPILLRVISEIYRNKFLFIPHGEWQQGLEYAYTLQITEIHRKILFRCLDISDYDVLLDRHVKTPVKIWSTTFSLDAEYFSDSAVKLSLNIKKYFGVSVPGDGCRGVIRYLNTLPLSRRFRFEEKEVADGKFEFAENLGRAVFRGEVIK